MASPCDDGGNHDATQALFEGVSPGPWIPTADGVASWSGEPSRGCGLVIATGVQTLADRAFIATAREAWPAAEAKLARLQALADEWDRRLREARAQEPATSTVDPIGVPYALGFEACAAARLNELRSILDDKETP